jgi:hypothetical protein
MGRLFQQNIQHSCHTIRQASVSKFPNDLSAHLWCPWGTIFLSIHTQALLNY